MRGVAVVSGVGDGGRLFAVYRRGDASSRVTGDLLAGMWLLLSQCIGAVPRTLLWDNEAGIGQRGRLAEGVAGFCGVLGTRLIQARPYDPETKGLVERANGYLRSSFLPGRQFGSPAQFNTQLADWLAQVANPRTHATTRMIPAQALGADRAAMAGCRRWRRVRAPR